MSKLLKLDGVKIGKSSVLVDTVTGNLRMGTKGRSKSPVEFVMGLPKTVRRAFRKMLHNSGYRHIAATTIPPKQRKSSIQLPSRDEWEEVELISEEYAEREVDRRKRQLSGKY